MMPLCPECNNELAEEANFCGKCGWRLHKPPALPSSPPKTSSLALICLILGILGLSPTCPITGLPAIIFGIAARMKIKRNPSTLKGNGLATAGIVLGCLSIILLGVIIVPNYIVLKTVEKMQRFKSDMRSIAVAMESYKVDHQAWPSKLEGLTSPIDYITEIPKEQFAPKSKINYFVNGQSPDKVEYFLWGIGPDKKPDLTSDLLQSISSDWTKNSHLLYERTYDATNGTFSAGDIWRANEDSPATR